jgi:hypothetical protein
MSWADRLQPAAITTPDSVRYEFFYDDVATLRNNKTSQYQFSDEQGALIQNFGLGIVNLPLIMYFIGEDYDLTALDFDESSALPGNSVLEHPIYGIKDIVIETVARTDSLKTAGNQAIYTLTITETIAEERVTSVEEISTDVNASIDDLAILNGDIMSIADYDLSNPLDYTSALSRLTNTMNQYRSKFEGVLAKADQARSRFESAITAVTQTLDQLILAPKDLFSAISQIAKIPGNAIANLKLKIEGYAALIQLFVGSSKAISGTSQDSKNQRIEAQAQVNALFGGLASSYLFAAENSAAGESQSVIDNAVIEIAQSGIGFVTRSESIQAAIQIIDALQSAQEFLDNEQQTSEDSPLASRFSVSPDTTQVLTEIVKKTAGNLINLSFRLKQERIIELQNATTFINICFDFYGSTKLNVIDFFLSTNDLVEDEFLLIPRGKQIRYYV